MIDRRLPVLLLVLGTLLTATPSRADDLADRFRSPPDSARPWVYWMVMDGNFGPGGITEDLEAMKRVGIGGLIFMEVDVGIPKGPVAFMSPRWRQHFVRANQEAARLGLEITMPASPGWTGSGGPWVKPEQSMQKLVASELTLAGPATIHGALAPAAVGRRLLPRRRGARVPGPRAGATGSRTSRKRPCTAAVIFPRNRAWRR